MHTGTRLSWVRGGVGDETERERESIDVEVCMEGQGVIGDFKVVVGGTVQCLGIWPRIKFGDELGLAHGCEKGCHARVWR